MEFSFVQKGEGVMIYRKAGTYLAQTLNEVERGKAMCDDYAKCILADPQILANIIKTIIPQFEDMSIDEIIPFGGYMRLQRRWRRIMTQIRSWSSYYRLLNVLRKKLHTDNIRSA